MSRTVLHLLRVSRDADIKMVVSHRRLRAIRSSRGSSPLKRKETNTFQIPSGAHHHAHIHCAHTCVKLKLSRPYIWLRMLFLLIKHFGGRRISKDTFSCFDGPRATRVIVTRCIYMCCGWCQQIEVEAEPMLCVSVCVCAHAVAVTVNDAAAQPGKC